MAHSPEYKAYIVSKEWYEKSNNCRKFTSYRCCLFPWLTARNAHHLTYKNFKSELPVRDIVPLSKIAHSIIHWRIFWKTPLRPYINFLLRVLMSFYILLGFLFPTKKR